MAVRVWRRQLGLSLNKPHPGVVAEPEALRAVEAPKVHYRFAMPHESLAALSLEQAMSVRTHCVRPAPTWPTRPSRPLLHDARVHRVHMAPLGVGAPLPDLPDMSDAADVSNVADVADALQLPSPA